MSFYQSVRLSIMPLFTLCWTDASLAFCFSVLSTDFGRVMLLLVYTFFMLGEGVLFFNLGCFFQAQFYTQSVLWVVQTFSLWYPLQHFLSALDYVQSYGERLCCHRWSPFALWVPSYICGFLRRYACTLVFEVYTVCGLHTRGSLQSETFLLRTVSGLCLWLLWSGHCLLMFSRCFASAGRCLGVT